MPSSIKEVKRREGNVIHGYLIFISELDTAGQLRILYIAVQLLSKRPSIFLGPDHTSCSTSSTVVVPQECLDAVGSLLDIFYTIKFPSLMYVGWSLSSYGLSQGLMFIFLNHRNADVQVVTEAKQQAESFKIYYRNLEDHFIEVRKSGGGYGIINNVRFYLDFIAVFLGCDQ